MVLVTEFKNRFPEFCYIDDDRITMFIEDAALLMGNPSKWLSFYDIAQTYYTAHLVYTASLTEAGDGGVVAPIKKQEVDDVIVEQAVDPASSSEGELGSTSYGKRFLMYRQRVFGAYIIGV